MTTISFEGWEARVVPKGAWGENRYVVHIDGEDYEVHLVLWEDGLLSLEIVEENGSRTIDAVADIQSDQVEITMGGRRTVFPLDVREDASARATSRASGMAVGPVRAELPGRILEVHVNEGDHVEAGQVLLVVEAMKMEHPIRAGADARVGKVHGEAGAQIQPGDVLVELLPAESD